MTAFASELEETFQVSAPVEHTAATFFDFDHVITCTRKAERVDRVGDDTLAFTLKPEQHGPTAFQAIYSVQYALEGDTLTWRTVGDGNLVNEGTARFRAHAGGTAVDWRQRIELELPVNRVIAKMLRPLVAKLSRGGMRRYVEHMTRLAEGKPLEA